jgi:hypothetical protein
MPSFGTLKADTLTHSTAGSLDTNYVVQGSAKYWVDFNGSGTVATRDSFNHSSLSDGGTGIYTISYTNSFNNASYCAACGQDDNAGSIAVPRQSTDLGTGSTVVRTTNGSAGSDQTYIHVALFGDLA